MFLPLAAQLTVAQAFPLQQPSTRKPYDQDDVDQYNILRFLGTSSPYIQHTGYGISREVPYGCEVTHANLIARHGERYPTTGTGKRIEKSLARLRSLDDDLIGPLAFIPRYEFEALDPSMYDEESYKGPYSGLGDMKSLGGMFRRRYEHLVDDEKDIKFYAASTKKGC